jgi:hypothetical protein
MNTPIAQDRLVRKEVALGVVRDYEPPKDHIGLSQFAPFQDVASDDVIFDYIRQPAVGMAPARAEDAESELAGKDESVGTGRASLIDWAQKDHYDASDVTRYRDSLIIGGLVGAGALPLSVGNVTNDFNQRVARDQLRRRRRLDNRIEWLIMTLLDTGQIAYNDGKIIFTVEGNRPEAAQDVDLNTDSALTTYFGETASDPIEDIIALQERAPEGVVYDRAIISKKAFRKLYKSSKFISAISGANPLYTTLPWGPRQAAEFIEDQTEMTFIVYDAVYTTRPLGSNTLTQNRFVRENSMIFLPSAASVDAIDDAIGFGKTLTAPHPEGNWTSGYYEWEKEDRDPWGVDFGTGIKAFPVMPHLDLTLVAKVLA